jgi:hypothetical protein
MKRRDNGHIETRQEINDVTAGLPTENSVFVLKGDDVETCIVQNVGTLSIFVDHLFANLKAHRRGIVIATTGVRHGDDTGFQIRARHRDRPMKIMGKGSDSTMTRKVIANECNTLELTH